jgi:hypothetical protein
MKTLFSEEIEIITPCFCAGANQAKAEIRAPSIRGELRWWFRALGGTQKEEQEIFGGMAGEDAKSSALVVRVSDVQPADPVKLPEHVNNQPDDPFYLLHYAKASGDGIRYQPDGYFSPGTRFRLSLLSRRSVSGLDSAQKAFLHLGAIGLRSTRACGAFYVPSAVQGFEPFKAWAQSLPENVQLAWAAPNGQPKFCSNWKSAFNAEAKIIKAFRGDGYSAGKSGNDPSPFGRSNPRQSSAVRLRPVQLEEGILPVVFYVPKILGADCQDQNFNLSQGAELQLAKK